MSAWSDWRVGAMSDEEYEQHRISENNRDIAERYELYEDDERFCDTCVHYKYNEESKCKCCESWDCEYEERE